MFTSLKMETADSFEGFVPLHQTRGFHIVDDSNLQKYIAFFIRKLSLTINPLKPSGHYMYHLSDSTFCPQSVFTRFVWIWQQTAIISLYSINWLVFMRVLTF